MFIRNSYVLIAAIALAMVTFSRPAAAQDASAVIDAVRQAIGKQLPAQVQVIASGSEYAPDSGDPASRRHYRIERFVQQLDLDSLTASERVVRVADPGDGSQSAPHGGTQDALTRSSASDEHVLWTNPFGFLAGTAARTATVRAETLFGTPYQVVTFTAAGGQQVHGYVTETNLLERTRTEVDNVPIESVFMSWQDFDGVRFPSLIIQKENGQLARVLVVSALERVDNAASAQ